MSEILHTDRSHNIGKLALALSQVQGEITGARKGSTNPFFQSNYADLASCWDACREPLAKNKLAVIQTTDNCKEGIMIITTLVHETGQYISGTLTLKPTKNDPQGIGSAITYGRRYALCAIVGLAQVDDDGNAASVGPQNYPTDNAEEKPITAAQVKKLKKLLADTKSDVSGFLKYAGAETFETISAGNYNRCLNALEAKK